jgi:hypothetical protein
MLQEGRLPLMRGRDRGELWFDLYSVQYMCLLKAGGES